MAKSSSYYAVNKEDFDKLTGGGEGSTSKNAAITAFGDVSEGQVIVVFQKAYEVTRETPKPAPTSGLKVKSTRSSGPRGPRKKKEAAATNETPTVVDGAAEVAAETPVAGSDTKHSGKRTRS